MKLSSVKWRVAYRKRYGDTNNPYLRIANPWWGWAADPFIFDENGETYIFAELWDYRIGKGCLGYVNLSDKRKKWIRIIDEPYHLSYPNVFRMNGQIYMCPESSAGNDVALYISTRFPDKWKKQSTILEGKYVDTTFFCYGNEWYGLTCKYHEKPNKLLLFRYEDGKVVFSKENPILEGKTMTRPGGHILREDDKYYRVSQDNKNFYGEAIIISEMEINWPLIQDKNIKRITTSDIMIKGYSKPVGIHTFNRNEDYEVVDLKYNSISLVELFMRIVRKITRK